MVPELICSIGEGGAAMTRKEELRNLATIVVKIYEMQRDLAPSAELHPEYMASVLVDAFADVEREVWEKSVKHLKTVMMLYGNDSWRERSAVEACAEWCEQQAKELGKLKSEICHWTLERYYQLEQENKTLREALQLLYDCQNGCPLPKYETDWNRAMQLSERALKVS